MPFRNPQQPPALQGLIDAITRRSNSTYGKVPPSMAEASSSGSLNDPIKLLGLQQGFKSELEDRVNRPADSDMAFPGSLQNMLSRATQDVNETQQNMRNPVMEAQYAADAASQREGFPSSSAQSRYIRDMNSQKINQPSAVAAIERAGGLDRANVNARAMRDVASIGADQRGQSVDLFRDLISKNNNRLPPGASFTLPGGGSYHEPTEPRVSASTTNNLSAARAAYLDAKSAYNDSLNPMASDRDLNQKRSQLEGLLGAAYQQTGASPEAQDAAAAIVFDDNNEFSDKTMQQIIDEYDLGVNPEDIPIVARLVMMARGQ